MKERTGLLIIYTGNGKGKTTAALGTIFRALGHGWKIAVIQFVKGDWPIVYGELETAKKFEANGQLLFVQKGTGFVRIMGDRKPIDTHVKAAEAALEFAETCIAEGQYDLVVLDEINGAIEGSLVSLDAVRKVLLKRLPHNYVILTGRKAPVELIEMADLVTEMKEVKHPFQRKIPAQLGIDY